MTYEFEESEILDKAAELFFNDRDVLDALNLYVRGFRTTEILTERLEYLKQQALMIAADILKAEAEQLRKENEADLYDEHESHLGVG